MNGRIHILEFSHGLYLPQSIFCFVHFVLLYPLPEMRQAILLIACRIPFQAIDFFFFLKNPPTRQVRIANAATIADPTKPETLVPAGLS